MKRLMSLVPVLGVLALAEGCASRGPTARDAQEQTTLSVRNDNYLDHTIYLIVGSDRVRLGTARGLSTTRFVIPAHYVFGATSLQFMADPIGSRVTPISERVSVAPGDEVELIIPARLESLVGPSKRPR
jgi:hypothetical protein